MEFESIDAENFSFDVVRKGYDRLQVEDFLSKVSRSIERLDERRKLAEVRTEQAERELTEVRTRAETTIQETVAARAELIASTAALTGAGNQTDSPAPALSTNRATIEAQQIVEQATHHAASIHAEAEAILAGALSTSARISDDRNEVLGSVQAERDALIAEATQEAEAIRIAAFKEAERTKAEAGAIRRQAESAATDLLSEARSRSVEIASIAERNREELPMVAKRPRAQTTSVDPSTDEPVLEEAPSPIPEPDVDELDQIAVDLRDEPSLWEVEPEEREERASRYKSRSANLPSLGKDAGSVIGGLDSLRTKHE
jgi:cell division septum initiation protein DivIVA